MGMLLTMALLLAVISAWLEFKLLKTVPGLRWLNRKSAFIGLAISIGISWMLGFIFGAAGLVVLLAGILSTFLTEPVHAFHRSASARKSQVVKGWSDFKATWRPIWLIAKYSMIILLLPIWLPIVIRNKLLALHPNQPPSPQGVQP